MSAGGPGTPGENPLHFLKQRQRARHTVNGTPDLGIVLNCRPVRGLLAKRAAVEFGADLIRHEFAAAREILVREREFLFLEVIAEPVENTRVRRPPLGQFRFAAAEVL